MCQDQGMMKCVFVQGLAEQHLLKMNISLEAQSPPRLVGCEAWGKVLDATRWAGGGRHSPAKAAGGELIWNRLERLEGSWCCVS